MDMDTGSGGAAGFVKETLCSDERIRKLEETIQTLMQRLGDLPGKEDLRDVIAAVKEVTTFSAKETQAVVKESLEEKGVCEQHIVEEKKRLEAEKKELKAKTKSLEQTEIGNYTKQINQANKERDAAIEERDDMAVETRILIAEAKTERRIEQLDEYGHLRDFKAVIEELDRSKAGKIVHRGTQLTAVKTFSLETYRRMFAIVMSKALDNMDNCSESPDFHRFVLGKYNGPIFSKMAVDELISACLKIITWMCEKLRMEVPPDFVAPYAPISGDPFALPEVI
jgi:vacuolar-type H+-ATPase subunit I/STV1